MQRWVRWAAALALALTGIQASPGDSPHLSLVPWKVVEPGDDVQAPLVLFWIPASRDEVRRSELLTSDELTLYSSQCVAMRVVRSDDDAMLVKLEAGEALPVAILTDGEGHVLGRVDNEEGALVVAAVEELVREELDHRVSAAETMLDEARTKAEAGAIDAAIALYQSVWEQRCVCPRQGRDAQRALKKLKAK
ncbi:MAG TPA: hypothetical protein VKB93_26895 [Thermoanaerobaculia bacterium]|nr:hypothetical protein [Thermoanaerobaculia bacterium]